MNQLTELQTNYRKRVLEWLELWASAEAQLQYQRDVPIAGVVDELFCVWFDDLNMEQFLTEQWFQEAFSARELAAVQRFHAVFEAESGPFPDIPIEKFVLTPRWATISGAAAEALRAFGE